MSLSGNEQATDRLLGLWVVHPEDKAAIRQLGQVSMKFEKNGRLTYTIHEKEKDQVIQLTYFVDDSHVVTNQPSHPAEERTRFDFDANGDLQLEVEGRWSRYCRPG